MGFPLQSLMTKIDIPNLTSEDHVLFLAMHGFCVVRIHHINNTTDYHRYRWNATTQDWVSYNPGMEGITDKNLCIKQMTMNGLTEQEIQLLFNLERDKTIINK